MRASFLRCGGRLSAFAAVAAVLAAGCGDPTGIGKTVPVQGKVTWGGQPLTAGIVTFNPDASAGNTSKLAPFGPIDADGTYTLSTGSATGTAKGAPPGKYKVTINVNTPMTGTAAPAAPPAIDAVYTDPAKTPLSVEVTESPAAGAYDLPLKK